MANVKILQLVSGDFVIGEEENDDNTPDYVMKNPCVVMMVPDPQQPERIGVQLRPLCPFTTEKTIALNHSFVLYSVTPVQDLVNQYNQIFGSGLVIAGPGSLPPDGTRPNLTRVK